MPALRRRPDQIIKPCTPCGGEMLWEGKPGQKVCTGKCEARPNGPCKRIATMRCMVVDYSIFRKKETCDD